MAWKLKLDRLSGCDGALHSSLTCVRFPVNSLRSSKYLWQVLQAGGAAGCGWTGTAHVDPDLLLPLFVLKSGSLGS